jgi:hypothetical protein
MFQMADNSESKVTKTRNAPQMPQPQKFTQSTWEPHRSTTGVPPDQHRRYPLTAAVAETKETSTSKSIAASYETNRPPQKHY